MIRLLCACLLAVVLLAGCSQPADIAIAFHEALAQRNGEKAYGLLSQNSRKFLQQRAQDAHYASNGQLSDDPSEMIVQGDPAFYSDVTHPGANQKFLAEYLSRSETSASVKVSIGARTEKLTMLQENGHWRVDLFPSPIKAHAGDRSSR